MRYPTTRLIAILASLLLVLSACGGEDEAPDDTAGGDGGAEAEDPGVEDSPGDEGSEVDFAGRELVMVVPFGPGGTADAAARMVASLLPSFLPGEPRITVENVEGGGGAVGMQDLLQRREPGEAMVVITTGITLRWLMGEEGHDYPLDQMHALSALPTSYIATAYDDTVTSFAELVDYDGELTWGHNDAATPGALSAVLIAQMSGMDHVDQVYGFGSDGETLLAFERREVDLASPQPAPFLDGIADIPGAIPLFETGMIGDDGSVQPSGAVEGLQTFDQVYEDHFGEPPSGGEYQAYLAVLGATAAQNAILMHPDTPDDLLAAIREGVQAMIESDEWSAMVLEQLGQADAGSGPEAAQSALDQLTGQDEATVQLFREVARG